MDELSGSREDLEQLAGHRVARTASPTRSAYQGPTSTPRRATRRGLAGYRYAVLNSPGTVTADTDRYGLPRLPVENTGADAFASLISRATGRS